MENKTNAKPGTGFLGGGKKDVRRILFAGIFWRILIIEGVLLAWSLIYRELTEGPELSDLVLYGLRIVLLIAIIILFMMVTLRNFLDKKIISPLEAISTANRSLSDSSSIAAQIEMPEDTPNEIQEIAHSRAQMLETILKVSDERLNLVNFIRDTFGRYLSKKVVDEILELPEGRRIGGQRKTVTILMSDLRGFTSLSEDRDPEEMVRLLNRYLASMSKVILDYDGIIDEFIGDGILAVFGVPDGHDDDASRAVACALSMQRALRDLNEEITTEGYNTLEMGIGINTGSVIVGNIGSEARVKYGIVGSPVNIASRIESNTVGGQVFIGESTYALVSEQVTTDPPQAVMMKGLKSPLVSYPVLAIGPPYNVHLQVGAEPLNGVQLNLPFHCWKVEEKVIASESALGETVMLNESLIIASITPPLEPLTDVKLRFDFCTAAHCFEDIYGKVLSAGEHEDGTRNHIGITSIQPEDKRILRKWMDDVS